MLTGFKGGWRLSGVLVCLLLCTGVLAAQSVLNLPRLVQRDGRFTGITLANPSNRSATVTLQLYDETGNGIPLTSTPSSFKLAPGAQFTQFDREMFPIRPGFRGWAQIASSDNLSLRGYYLVGDDAVTLLDGANGAQAYREQILPFLFNNADIDTEITIVNPTNQVAYAGLHTITFDGQVSGQASTGLTLQPHAVFRKNTKELFSPTIFSDGSYYSINSNVGLLAMELVENHANPEIAVLTGVDVNAADRVMVFPQAVGSGDYYSILGVINLLSIQQTVTVALYQADGSLLNTGSVPNPISVALGPQASLRTSLVDLFQLNSLSVPFVGGWVKVESNFGPISGFIAYGNYSTPLFTAVAPQVSPVTHMVFSHLAPQSLGYFTGLALLNPNASTASVKLTVIDPNGLTVGERQLQLEPNQRIAQAVFDLVPEAKDLAGGSLVVTSDQPLYGVELFGSTNNRVLANVPVSDVADYYLPPEQGKFVLSGRLTQEDGIPLADATVQISGSVPSTTVTTNAQGEYFFLNLSNGNYAVEPLLKNFEFAPAAASVSINNSSVGDADFLGKRLASLAITSISPPSGPVGSPVTIRGAGFSTIPSENTVHFNGTLAPTIALKNPAPVDDTITVLVPAGAQTGRVLVSIGSAISNPVQFSVTEYDSKQVSLPAAVPTSVAISGLGNLALVGHSESDTISLVGLTPNPSLVQHLSWGKVSHASILAVATDDDGRGGGTSRDDDIGFFNIALAASTALQSKVARYGAKVDRPAANVSGSLPLTTADVHFVQLPTGSEPVSLAFEPFGRFAMTANRGTDSVSFVEFLSDAIPVLRGSLSLPQGSKPVSVSVAADGRRALVANSAANSVSVIEFAQTPEGFLSGNLQPVVTRNFLLDASPNGVAINLDASRGVTANADNTASILNLNGPADGSSITTVPLPKFTPGPPVAVSVALAPNGSYAIVTSRDPSGNSYLSVLSLQGIPEVAFVEVLPKGSGTSAVAIGPDSASFLVANPELSNVSMFSPTPGNLLLDTLSLSRARVKESITFFGAGFSPDAKENVVRFQSSGQATIPAPLLSMTTPNQITVEVPVGAVSGPVTVNVGPSSSNQQFFIVLPDFQNPVPIVTAVQPSTVLLLRSNTLLIQGNGFIAQSVVEVDLGDGAGPQMLTSVFPTATVSVLDSSRMQVIFRPVDVANLGSSFTLDVMNPLPGGGRSSSVTVVVVHLPPGRDGGPGQFPPPDN